MTIQAQDNSRRTANLPAAERPTTIGARHPVCINAYALLDHRTRGRCLPRAGAPQGRYLEVEHDDELHLIPLDRPITHLGRGIAADIRIEDPEVSRRHAIVAQRGDGVRVLDDRSRNGTFVNSRPVTVGYLGDGDVLRLGRVVFRFIEIEPPRDAVRPLRRIGLAARDGRSVRSDAAA
jgi:Inner membrane component of T3SS, cytoplasmic domain